MKNLIFISLIATLLFPSCSRKEKTEGEKVQYSVTDTIGSSTDFLADLQPKKTLKTYDQSLTDFLKSEPIKPDSIRKIIYLLPLGDMDTLVSKELTEEISYLEKFFQLKVKIMPSVSFDDLKKISKIKTRMVSNSYYGKGNTKSNIHTQDEQIEANSLIKNYIIPNKPKDAVVVIGITTYDIYLGNYNYIFGTSSLLDGTAIVSIHRLMDYEIKMNIKKVVSKQITNMFGIPNVKDYQCLLNYSDSIEELSEGVTYLSPPALQKLKLAIGFDYKKRFKELREYWKENNNPTIANYYDKCLSLIENNKKIPQ